MRILFFIFIFVLSIQSFKAQTDDVYTGTLKKSDSLQKKNRTPPEWLKKVTYEGNLQFQLSNYTFIYLSPTIGYSPFKKLNVGLGVIYNYISFNYGAPYPKVTQSIFGGHSYARYFVSEGFFIQAQYDKLRQPDVFGLGAEKKKWVDYTLVGFGFRKPIGNKIGLSGTVLYNLTPSPLSIYYSRLIVQFGFMGTF